MAAELLDAFPQLPEQASQELADDDENQRDLDGGECPLANDGPGYTMWIMGP